MSNSIYYKIRPKNISPEEYFIVECSFPEHDFSPTIDLAIQAYEDKLRNQVDFTIEQLTEQYQELKEFLHWKEHKDE